MSESTPANTITIAAPPTSKRFRIGRTPITGDYDIATESGSPLYWVDKSSLTPGKPDITIHAGPDSSYPVLAISHFPHFSGDFKIGLSDPARPQTLQWEDLTKESFTHGEYRFAMNFSNGRNTFVWKRTHSVGVDGSSPLPLSTRNFKLVGGSSNNVLAVFTNSMSLTKCGTLQINVDYGPEFGAMVLITCISIYEKARRRKHRGRQVLELGVVWRDEWYWTPGRDCVFDARRVDLYRTLFIIKPYNKKEGAFTGYALSAR
ncbi:hypothetical protein PT974_02307 [Cladobotryum mycophilum]|uniref:Uncharacterized protein n=1 Tax=Cladobotryum mycophilum TaxID=491253 RepID=A0ABR0SXT3_9HYPO